MSLEELEAQLLNPNPIDRLHLIQSVLKSFVPAFINQPHQDALVHDRAPDHPLRHLPLTISPDFDEPMTDLWDALEE